LGPRNIRFESSIAARPSELLEHVLYREKEALEEELAKNKKEHDTRSIDHSGS
jgi:hypothetical protein